MMSSPLLISDDEAEQEKGFDDSVMIVEDYEAPSTPLSASSTAKPPANGKCSPLLISDDEAEQEKGFDDSVMMVEDYEAPARNGNGTDYGDEDVMIIDELPDIPDLPEAGNEEKQITTSKKRVCSSRKN